MKKWGEGGTGLNQKVVAFLNIFLCFEMISLRCFLSAP